MKVVVITSGGLDSTVLLHHHHTGKRDEVRALAIDYGQRHRRELGFAEINATKLNVPFEVANVKSLRDLLPGSSQTSSNVAVPHGRYDEESMKATVVPNRNMILLSIAIGHAIAHKFEAVSYAAHAGDHAIYPDCREEFVNALEQAALLADWIPIKIMRPFVHTTKAGIVKVGNGLGVNFLSTYSCYEGGAIHCGKCGTCVERIMAFKEAGVPDPTKYLDSDYWKHCVEPAKS